MKFFTTIGNSPLLKALFSQVVATAVSGIDYAISHPTGGFANTLAHNPEIGMLYVAAAQFVHNLFSKYFPPQAPAAAPAAPAQK